MKRLITLLVLTIFNVGAFATGHTVTISSTNVFCNGDCNGTATANVSGGVGPFSFSWNSAPVQISQTSSNLCPGSYTVTVTDGNDGSTATASVTISQPPQLVISVSSTSVSCFGGSNGSATATVTGGTPGYTYTWSPGGVIGTTFTGAAAGTYTVVVTDANGCNATASVTINQPPQLVVSTSSTNTSCFGMSDGTAVSFLSGGTSPYTYSWSPSGGTSPTLSGAMAGTYTLTVTDANNCIAFSTVTISQPQALVVSISSTNTTCGLCDGQAAATGSGGSAPYSFSWFPGNLNSQSIAGLCSGTYTVTFMDANGCGANASATITSSSNISSVTSSVTNASCGNSDGAIAINNVNGGTPPFSYSWSPGGQVTSSISGLPAGIYNLSVSDSIGCIYSTPISVINAAGPTAVSITTVSSNCNSATGQINIGAVTGGTGPYSYSLNGSAFTSTVNYTGLAAGNYNVGIKDANLCAYYTTITVSNLSSPVITLDTLVNASCNTGVGGSVSINVSGGTPGYSFLWNNGATTQNITGVFASMYNVIVSDAAGCNSTQSFFVPNSSVVHASVTSTYASCGGSGTATVYPSGGTPPYTYSWNTVPTQTTQTATGLNHGNSICTITDANGCNATVYVWIWANCYNIIKGRIYNDVNGNCIQDAGEQAIAGRPVYSSGSSSGYGYTDANGDYTIYTTSMNNTVTQILPLYSVQVCPVSSQAANFSSLGDTIINVDFGDQVLSNVNDLVVNYYPGTARPGFSQWGYMTYKNAGTTVMNGVTINLMHDSILTYNSSPTANSYTYPNISWNIGTLNPGQTGYIYAYFTVPVISAGGYLGRILNYTAQINPVAGDTTPVNNVVNASTMIVGSYDPNDKAVSPAGNVLVTDSILHYTIRFQNSGTDTAFTIVLKDTLSQFLDPSTIEPGIASHPYTFNISFDGELTWTFNNILLPDSNRNEPGSHGFVKFSVKQRENNPIGTQIENTAHIYFDFNEAIVTNTVSNTVVDITTDIETSSSYNVVKVYPNPFTENTTFVISSNVLNETYSFEMSDVLGKKVKQIRTNEKQFTVSRDGLPNGMYFYSITNSDGVVAKGKVIIK